MLRTFISVKCLFWWGSGKNSLTKFSPFWVFPLPAEKVKQWNQFSLRYTQRGWDRCSFFCMRERDLKTVRYAPKTLQVAWEAKMICVKIRKWTEWNSGNTAQTATSCTGKMKTFNCGCFVMRTNSETKLLDPKMRERKRARSHVKGVCVSSDYRKERFLLGLSECSFVFVFQGISYFTTHFC